jgi:DNA-binding GntR family transcriptional regulator
VTRLSSETSLAEAVTIGPLAKSASLRETVTQILRAAIISGEMAPGEVHSAPSLGARFGVSATPVREAMVDLSRAGLVETVPNKGFRVTAISEAELDEIAALRMLIEPPTVREVTPRIPADAMAGLRALAQAIVDHAAAGDLIGYTEADRRFHLAILAFSNNRRLVSLVSELRSQTRLYGLAGLAERGALAGSAAEHLDLVDLIAARDARGAASLMRRHIGRVRAEWAKHPS